ncbi:MAG: TetR/AcrR family transcriptional regulator [Bacteroidota bacterium]
MTEEAKQAENTEEKIRQVAKRLFTERGYNGTKIRDVAEEAGVNIALLNYYFRSKERLYESIVIENFQEYLGTLAEVLNEPDLPLEERLRRYVTQMIDTLKANPDLAFFIMNEGRNNGEFCQKFLSKYDKIMTHSKLAEQLQHEVEIGSIRSIDMFMLDSMLHAQLIMPFIQLPIWRQVDYISDADFDKFLEQLKQTVPDMIMAYLRSRP